MKKLLLFALLFVSVIRPQAPSRLSCSPYPASLRTDTLYKITESNYSASQVITIATMQGVLAQTKPRIYRIPSSIFSYWLSDLRDNYGVKVLSDYDNNFSGLLQKFKGEIKGYILCNLNDNSLNTAISLCGLTQGIAITAEYENTVKNAGYTLIEDVRGKDEYWFFNKYKDQINKDVMCYINPSSTSFTADYSVFGKIMSIYRKTYDTTLTNIFNSYNKNAAVIGWGPDEYGFVSYCSNHSMYVNAADYAANLSVLSNFEPVIKQKEPVVIKNNKTNLHTVCFLMTDGDNIQYVMGGFYSDTKWYGSTKRGATNIGWTVAPAAGELIPSILQFLYKKEMNGPGKNDYFVAGPSGYGYMYPDKYPALESFAKNTNDFMKKSDLSIVNIIGSNDSLQYLDPFCKQPDIDAVFYYFYDNYSGGKGKIKFVDNKPVIYGRYNLWDIFESPTSLATKLNNSTKDIFQSTSYSLIPVHVWSMSVDDVNKCASLLDSTVRVVSPKEFVNLVNKNLGPRNTLEKVFPADSLVEAKYIVNGSKGTGVDATHRWADGTDKLIYHFSIDDLLKLSNGNTDIKLSFTVANEYVVSAANSLAGTPNELYRWSKFGMHYHDASNKATLSLNFDYYIENGWKDLYLIFEDGINSDAWGPSVYNVTLYAPQGVITDVKEHGSVVVPGSIKLEQNYPNPFNPSTLITYSLSKPSKIKLEIFDVLGRRINTVVDSFQQSGNYKVSWQGKNDSGNSLSNGVYFYRLIAGEHSITKKMVLMK